MAAQFKGFPALLYYHLIHSGKHRIEEVARKVGVSASALYKHAEGEINFPPDLIPNLYNATGEKDFVDFLVKGTDQMLTPRPGAKSDGRSLELETLDVTSEVGELAAHIRKAIEDGRVSEIEIRQIERTLNALQREVEEVRQKVRKA